MEKNEYLLEKVKSKYIIQNIYSYLEDQQLFLKKLFKYSKNLQKKIGMNLFYYQENFINNRFKWQNYLYFERNKEIVIFSEDKLKQNLKNDINGYNMDDNIIKKIFLNHFQKILNNINDNLYEYSEFIEFNSPFFEFILSKKEIFEKIFSIIIPMDLINEEKLLKKYYISKFNELNKNNIKYSSLCFYIENDKDANNIKDLKIKFNQIKKLDINQNIQYFLSNNIDLFSFLRIANNLVYLSINIFSYEKIDFSLTKLTINSNSFQFINSLKSLRYLKLYYIKFINSIILDLPSLNKLALYFCDNISIKTNFAKLKSFILESTRYDTKQISGFSELEEIVLNYVTNSSDNIKLNFLKNLKYFKGYIKDFLTLESPLLEEVDLCQINSFNYIKEMYDKFNSIKLLKTINLKFMEIDDINFALIKTEKLTITRMHLLLKIIKNSNPSLLDLLSKFPNLTDFFLEVNNLAKILADKGILEFIEKPECKIKNIHITLDKKQDLKLYLESYQKLESFSLIFLENYDNFNSNMNINSMFPIFNDKCDVIFKSLKSLNIKIPYNITFQGINNLYNNINNIPNLTDFSLYCKVNEIENDFYVKFIGNILSMKFIKKVNICLNKNEKYTINELKQIFLDIKFIKFYEINIYKLYANKSSEIQKDDDDKKDINQKNIDHCKII